MPKRKNNKKGGCVKSSIQKGGDAWTNDFSNLIGHKATTINRVTNCPKIIPPVLNNSNVPEIVDLNRQLGGSYMFIINPKTNRKVNIMGKLGKKIIKNYFLQLNLI